MGPQSHAAQVDVEREATPWERARSELDQQLERLAMTVHRLSERLDPVLMPAEPSAADEVAAKMMRSSSSLVLTVDHWVDSVRRTVDNLHQMLDRLDT